MTLHPLLGWCFEAKPFTSVNTKQQSIAYGSGVHHGERPFTTVNKEFSAWRQPKWKEF